MVLQASTYVISKSITSKMQWKAGFTTTGSEIEPSTGLHRECESTAVLQLTIGSFSNDEGDGNEDVKKAIGLITQNNNFARASRFFVLFFTVLVRLRRENA